MRVWLADLLMLGGGCAVVAGSPFGLAWYLVPPLITAGIAAAAVGLAVAPTWWRAGALGGIALVGLAFVLFALHALAGLAYLALGVAILITLSLRDRRRGPPAP